MRERVKKKECLKGRPFLKNTSSPSKTNLIMNFQFNLTNNLYEIKSSQVADLTQTEQTKHRHKVKMEANLGWCA